MSEDTIDTPWCPCQEERFEAQYPDLPKDDMPYVDEVDYLVEVKSRFHYEHEREKNRDPNDLSRSGTHPQTPYTYRGEKIIDENFPDADLVCPMCEQGYEIERTVRKVESNAFMERDVKRNQDLYEALAASASDLSE